MRRRRRQREPWILAGCFVGSALLHLVVGLPLRDAAGRYLAGTGSGPPPPVKVVRLSPEQWSSSMRAAAEAAARSPRLQPSKSTDLPPLPSDEKLAKKEEKKPEKKPEEKLSGQIVEVPPSADDRPNPEAKYLSKYNAHTDKETTARPEERDRTKKRVTNKLQSTEQPGTPQEAIPTPGITMKGDGAEVDRPGEKGEAGEKGKGQFVLEMPDLRRRDEVNLKLSDLPGVSQQRVPNRSGSDALKGNSERFNLELGEGLSEGGESGAKRGDPNAPEKRELPSLAALAPTIGTVARISGSPSNDYVEGVPEGDGTFLNTKEFKYATFFYRVKDSVASRWEDMALREYRRRDPTGNIYGTRDRATLLHIQLDRAGRIEDIRVEQSSGVDFLDSVAVQAFRMAEPFPNPPAGIADADGNIRFNFQFVVTMRGRGPLNLFR